MKAFANVISSAAMSVALASSALGAEMYPKMYDASYVYKSPAGVCNIRMISDGNGKVREERDNGGLRSFSITDYPSKTIYSVSDAIRLIKKAPLKEAYEGPMNAELAKKRNAKYLGLKTIKGLTCNGWLFKQDGNEAEMWLEKSADFIVLSKSKVQDMTIEMELTSSSTATPAPELFALPSNYRTVSQ
jgi:hypothetical protein